MRWKGGNAKNLARWRCRSSECGMTSWRGRVEQCVTVQDDMTERRDGDSGECRMGMRRA